MAFPAPSNSALQKTCSQGRNVGFAVAEQVTQERHDSEDLRKVRIYERYTCEDGVTSGLHAYFTTVIKH